MKKIFAKELAALAVLALAFTGCNTAFEGTNANFAEKEAEYTDRSGATINANNLGNATVPGTSVINNTNKRNEITVTISSFSKINLSSADEAIHFQQLTNNTANAAYYPVRGADLPKTRTRVTENAGTTTITYEVDGTGVTANKVAFFVDATKLKTRGGTPVLARDGNLKRGEVSDSVIDYINTNGTTVLTYTYAENFRPGYTPMTGSGAADPLSEGGKLTGKYRSRFYAANKSKPGEAAAYDDLSSKMNVVLQYREPGERSYKTQNISYTYHPTAQTTAGDSWDAYSYTADFGPFVVGTYYRIVSTMPEGFTAPAWYSEVYGHPGIAYQSNRREGAKAEYCVGLYTLHKEIPSYIVVDSTSATTGTDHTSAFVPQEISETAIKNAQKDFFTVSNDDNWFKVSPSSAAVRDILDPATTKDFIVVDANNKKIAADVEVITYSYNDSTALSGKVNYVKVTVKDVRYRNSVSGLNVCVGEGVKIKENKYYPNQKSFGQWKDVIDDDKSGYVQISN